MAKIEKKKILLPSALWSLSKETIKLVEEGKASNTVVKSNSLYIRTKINDFKYNKGASGYSSLDEYVQKIEWHWRDQHNFTEKIKEREDFKQIASLISSQYKQNFAQAEYWLLRIIQKISLKAFEKISEEDIVENIAMFIADLDHAPLAYEVKSGIDGVWLENLDSELHLNEEIKVRAIKASDLEKETSFDSIRFGFSNDSMHLPTAFIEINKRYEKQEMLYDDLEIVLNTLRLFKLGSVYAVRTNIDVKSIINGFGSYSPTMSVKMPTYSYELSDEDLTGLIKLYNLITEINKTKLIFSRQPELSNPIAIALKRYNEALTESNSDEARLSSTISCFEALYLDEKAELAHRLSQRAAYLLKHFKLIPHEIYKNLHRAYEIRSLYSHGSFVDPKEHKDLHELAGIVINYARLSLLAYIQLINICDKAKIINKIDNSLIDEKASQAFSKIILKHCHSYS